MSPAKATDSVDLPSASCWVYVCLCTSNTVSLIVASFILSFLDVSISSLMPASIGHHELVRDDNSRWNKENRSLFT